MFLMISLYQLLQSLSFSQCLDQQVSEQSQCISKYLYLNSLAGGRDYQEICFFDVFLIFYGANRQLSFNVTIIDDPIFELDESFTLELRFDPFALKPPSNVILSPNTTTVDVIDNEGIIIIIDTIFQ